MIPEYAVPIPTVEPICGLPWVITEGDFEFMQGEANWNAKERFSVIGEGKDQRVLSLDEADGDFFARASVIYAQIPLSASNAMLEVGVNMGLSLSQLLNHYSLSTIEATNILYGEAGLLQKLAPDLHKSITQFHVGTLDALVKLRLLGKRYNVIQGLRSFQNMDTEANPDIVKSYFYWLGQLQNPGDVLISSVFTDGFLEVAAQAWNTGSPANVKRQTFTRQTLGDLLASSGYDLLNCVEFDETDSMKRFFQWIIAKPGNTDLLFMAQKIRKADNLSLQERETLTAWLDGYITCNPYPNPDFDVSMGELRTIKEMTERQIKISDIL